MWADAQLARVEQSRPRQCLCRIGLPAENPPLESNIETLTVTQPNSFERLLAQLHALRELPIQPWVVRTPPCTFGMDILT